MRSLVCTRRTSIHATTLVDYEINLTDDDLFWLPVPEGIMVLVDRVLLQLEIATGRHFIWVWSEGREYELGFGKLGVDVEKAMLELRQHTLENLGALI